MSHVAYPHSSYGYGPYAHHGRQLIEHLHKMQLPGGSAPSRVLATVYDSLNRNEIPVAKVFLHDADKSIKPVGIIGAGVGGLYTALMLDSLDIEYEILEASSRTGGRLFTYKFPGGGRYDYYDVGAMRFPQATDGKPGVMTRLFNLFSYPPLNTGKLRLNGSLVPYYFTTKGNNGFLLYNNVRARQNEPRNDFRAEEVGIDPVYIKAGVDAIVSDVLSPFADRIWKDLDNGTDEGWKYLQSYDAYSVRAYMSFKYRPSASLGLPDQSLPTNVVNWCETFSTSTNSFDRSLAQAVLDNMEFEGRPGGELTWWRLDGGSHVLSDSLTDYITSKNPGVLLKSKLVTAIAPLDETQSSPLKVTVLGEELPRVYSHVISTLPLPRLRTLDISACNLTVKQSNALRELQYGPSTKIGFLFKTAWWATGNINITGGQSYTDRPIRTVVYPSQENGKSKVLLASYCWTDDAERLGSLMGTGQQIFDDQLWDLVLGDLAALHDVSVEYLKQEYVDHHVWDWNHNPLTMGAFAQFGPGEFESLYDSLNSPAAKGRLHFAGEALSVRHAWVVGALDSAWRVVYEYLILTDKSKLPEFFRLWGRNQEWARSLDEEKYNPQDDLLLEHLLLNSPELF